MAKLSCRPSKSKACSLQRCCIPLFRHHRHTGTLQQKTLDCVCCLRVANRIGLSCILIPQWCLQSLAVGTGMSSLISGTVFSLCWCSVYWYPFGLIPVCAACYHFRARSQVTTACIVHYTGFGRCMILYYYMHKCLSYRVHMLYCGTGFWQWGKPLITLSILLLPVVMRPADCLYWHVRCFTLA